jgi:hypothetical protein
MQGPVTHQPRFASRLETMPAAPQLWQALPRHQPPGVVTFDVYRHKDPLGCPHGGKKRGNGNDISHQEQEDRTPRHGPSHILAEPPQRSRPDPAGESPSLATRTVRYEQS